MMTKQEIIEYLNLAIESIDEQLSEEVYMDGYISDDTLVDELDLYVSILHYLEGGK